MKQLSKALRADGKGWVEGFPFNTPSGKWFIHYGNRDLLMSIETIPKTLCPSSGLTDEDGKEGFYNDTLSHPYYGNGKIDYCEEEASFILDFNEGDGELMQDWMFTMSVLKECKITGNINDKI